MGFNWDGLPKEIRLLILEVLVQDGYTLSRLVTVSREWQTELERYNFAQIKLTPSRLVDFSSIVHRNRALVGYIWFFLELDDYDCTKCAPIARGLTNEELVEAYTDSCPITTAFQNLFSVLSTWGLDCDLTLDIGIYSPRDSKRWFKHLTFIPEAAVNKVFHPVMDEGPFYSDLLELQWWDQLPSVPAVTSLLLRQQNRRKWKPTSLICMFAQFPRLREVHYEPWREWDIIEIIQKLTDRDYQYSFKSIPHFNNNLQRLIVSENFDQQYPAFMQRFQFRKELVEWDIIRNPAPAFGRIAGLVSLKLKHLAAPFIVDASHFFDIEPFWEWPNLTSLVLTSKLLTSDGNSIEIGAMLRAAAAAAIKMPRLGIMEIWNGQRRFTALFRYQAFRDIRQATIIWRGLRKLTIEPSVLEAWEAVHQYDGWRLKLV